MSAGAQHPAGGVAGAAGAALASLDDMRVLDLSWLLPGPFATMLLADLGADVVKVERPGDGDYARTLLPEVFQVVNRNKRSMTLNLKHDDGRRILHELARGADVLVEGFRPGVMRRLDADYDTLAAVNPGLVYCSISGYGQESPYQDRPGHDISYMGVGGGISTPSELGYPPLRGSLPVADLSSAMFAALSVLAALRTRDATGRGQHLDVSITDCVASWSAIRLANLLWNDEEPVHRLSATSRVYETADGKRLSLSVTEDVFWQKLCQALGRDDWAADERLATTSGRLDHADELRGELEQTFVRRPRADWLAAFETYDVPGAAVHDPADVLTDAHVLARGLLWERSDDGRTRRVIGYPVQTSGAAPSWHRMPPELGEHTDDVLAGAGYDSTTIARFRGDGVV